MERAGGEGGTDGGEGWGGGGAARVVGLGSPGHAWRRRWRCCLHWFHSKRWLASGRCRHSISSLGPFFLLSFCFFPPGYTVMQLAAPRLRTHYVTGPTNQRMRAGKLGGGGGSGQTIGWGEKHGQGSVGMGPWVKGISAYLYKGKQPKNIFTGNKLSALVFGHTCLVRRWPESPKSGDKPK